MATTLLKLIMTAEQPTTTVNPTAIQYFNTAPVGGYTGAASYVIDDIDWIDDSGTAVTAGGLVPAASNNGFYQLFINGQLQEGDILTSVTPTAVTITFGAATTIEEGKIITLVVTNFNPDTTAPVITG